MVQTMIFLPAFKASLNFELLLPSLEVMLATTPTVRLKSKMAFLFRQL